MMWTKFILLYWKVYTSEGLSLASRLGVLFSEISVAESASDLDTVLNPVIVGVWRRKKEAFHEEQKVRRKCFYKVESPIVANRNGIETFKICSSNITNYFCVQIYSK